MSSRKDRYIAVFTSVALLSCGTSCARAQTASATAAPPAVPEQKTESTALPANSTDPLQDEQLRIGIQDSFQFKRKLREPEVMPQDFVSVFFTLWQHSLLQEAKAGFITRKPTMSELKNSGDAIPANPQRGIREISLGGIVYKQAEDWTIWLNGQRVTPEALPEGVLDLRVAEDHIDLKWFDRFTNLIYPIRLHSHQRFNLDARIFLPGQGVQ
jgi:hypothetical protein